MINERIEIWKKEEYHYPAAHGFIPVMLACMMKTDYCTLLTV